MSKEGKLGSPRPGQYLRIPAAVAVARISLARAAPAVPAAAAAVLEAAAPELAAPSGAEGPVAVAVLRRQPAAESAAATAAAAAADGVDAHARDRQCRVHGVWVVQQPAVVRMVAVAAAGALLAGQA